MCVVSEPSDVYDPSLALIFDLAVRTALSQRKALTSCGSNGGRLVVKLVDLQSIPEAPTAHEGRPLARALRIVARAEGRVEREDAGVDLGQIRAEIVVAAEPDAWGHAQSGAHARVACVRRLGAKLAHRALGEASLDDGPF